VASHVQDDGFHEIQLNGKQLVFLFMAATVVSVVIFLCGVLVGRGVRAERVAGDVASNSASEALATTPQQPAAAPAPAPAGSDPTTVAPPPAANEDLTYFNRLEKQKVEKEEKLKTSAEPPVKPAPAPAATLPPAEKSHPGENVEKAPPVEKTPPPAKTAPVPAPAAPPPAAPTVAASAEPAQSGPGYAVQVAALNVKSEADAIAKRLSSKGYTAYVLAPATGTPSVYRVRVGKFPTRREADSIAARLKKEEQFNPWVTR
jgi:cell division septation protein DedD